MSVVRSALYALRLARQVIAYAVSGRHLGLAVVLIVAPLLMLAAAIVGVASSFVIYPFL